MSALYTMADLFTFPTLYEGFRIPVIEAQRCGTPVLTSKVSALPEVAGDGACYVDLYSMKDISTAMERILRDEALVRSLVIAGYENARRFSWKTSILRIKEIIEGVNKVGL